MDNKNCLHPSIGEHWTGGGGGEGTPIRNNNCQNE